MRQVIDEFVLVPKRRSSGADKWNDDAKRDSGIYL